VRDDILRFGVAKRQAGGGQDHHPALEQTDQRGHVAGRQRAKRGRIENTR